MSDSSLIRPDPARILGTWMFAARCEGPAFRWLLGAMLVGTALFWFFATVLMHETNRNRLSSDQQYNIDLSRDTPGTLWPSISKGVVNPLWPWVVSHFNEGTDEATFQRGRWLNLCLSWMALLALGLGLSRILPLLPLLVTLGLSAFGCLLPQAVYFQPETLYYLFFIGAWLCCWRLLVHNPLWLYSLLGLCGGMAYLAKGSILPLLAGFIAISGLRWLVAVIPALRNRIPTPEEWKPLRHLLGLVSMGGLILLLLAPHMIENKKTFGSLLHSYPSYWMWQEDFGSESIPFMTRFNSKSERAKLTAEEIPSAGNYIRKYGMGRAMERLRDGTSSKLKTYLLPEGEIKKHKKGRPWKELLRYRGIYPLLLLLCAGILSMIAWSGCGAKERWTGLLRAMLLLGPLTLYCLLYGWYDVIGRGDRFMMSLYVPMVLFPVLAGNTLLRFTGVAGRRVTSVLLSLVGVLMICRLVQVLQNPHFL